MQHLIQKPVPTSESDRMIEELLGNDYLPFFAVVEESAGRYCLFFYPNKTNGPGQLLASLGSLDEIQTQLSNFSKNQVLSESFPLLEGIGKTITTPFIKW